LWGGYSFSTKIAVRTAIFVENEYPPHKFRPRNFVGRAAGMTTAVLRSFVTGKGAEGHWRRPFLRRNGPKPRHAAGGQGRGRRPRRSQARCWRRLPKLGERLAPGAQGQCEPPWGAAAEPRRCGRSRFGGGGFYSNLNKKRPKTVGYSASQRREPRCFATRECGASC